MSCQPAALAAAVASFHSAGGFEQSATACTQSDLPPVTASWMVPPDCPAQ